MVRRAGPEGPRRMIVEDLRADRRWRTHASGGVTHRFTCGFWGLPVGLTENLRTAQPLLQFLRTKCHCAFLEILHLFGPDSLQCGQPEGCELRHFCLFWQLISVTISRRSAAAGCADAQTVPCKTVSARRRHGVHVVRAHVSDGAAVVRGKCTPARLLARQQQQARRQHQQEEGGERRRQPHCAKGERGSRCALSDRFCGNSWGLERKIVKFSFACGALLRRIRSIFDQNPKECLRLRQASDPSHGNLWYAPNLAWRTQLTERHAKGNGYQPL